MRRSEWYPCVSVRHLFTRDHPPVVKLPPAGSYMLYPLGTPESQPRARIAAQRLEGEERQTLALAGAPSLLANLKHIVEQTGAEIVLSSTWREHNGKAVYSCKCYSSVKSTSIKEYKAQRTLRDRAGTDPHATVPTLSGDHQAGIPLSHALSCDHRARYAYACVPTPQHKFGCQPTVTGACRLSTLCQGQCYDLLRIVLHMVIGRKRDLLTEVRLESSTSCGVTQCRPRPPTAFHPPLLLL